MTTIQIRRSVEGWPAAIIPPHTGTPAERAIASLTRLLRAGYPLLLAFSSGKDSSACANLLLSAAVAFRAQGGTVPPITIMHSDTGVENPVVRALADAELAKIRAFALKHRLPLAIEVGRPTLASNFATRVIGGRALPSFPQSTRDCSVNWKVDVSARIARRVMAGAPAGSSELVTIIGTRSEESGARSINTAKRGESSESIWRSPAGDARLSPILDWTLDDVWTYLAEAAAGVHLAYSDFADVMEFYANAGGSSCVIVADMATARDSTACGARSGCLTCVAVGTDRSVETMIADHPGRYPYLVPLLAFRNFIADTQWDWSLRNFVGRTINEEGYIRVAADQYSPAMVEDLLFFALAAQDEANRLGSPSHVEIVGIRELIAIDFYWSARAWHPPFHALWCYFEHIQGRGRRAPKIATPARRSPQPVLGRIHVGLDWNDGANIMAPLGMRHPVWEMFLEGQNDGILRRGSDGMQFLRIAESADSFDVDEEGAVDFLSFIAAEKIAEMHRQDHQDWTVGAMTYLQYGFVMPAKGQSATLDNMMRRAQWLQRHGLHGHQTMDALKAKCVDSHVEHAQECFAF